MENNVFFGGWAGMGDGVLTKLHCSIKHHSTTNSIKLHNITNSNESQLMSSDLSLKLKNPSTVLLLDGGISTHLESLIAKPFPDRNLWSSSLLSTSEGQAQIQSVHLDFLKSGSDIITTVTYQLSYVATRHGYTEENINDMLHIAVEKSRDAIKDMNTVTSQHESRNDGKRYILGSIGCYGSALADGSEYSGKYSLSVAQIMDFHREKLKLFRHEHVSGVIFETIPSIIEVEAILLLLRENYDSECRQITCLSLACQDQFLLNDGTPVTSIFEKLQKFDPGTAKDSLLIDCIGVNCCKVQHIYSLSQSLAKFILESNVRRTIALYPNSGEEWDAPSNCWKIGSGCTNPESFANELMKCVRSIHSMCHQYGQPEISIIIGGCCRTNPVTIGTLKRYLEQYKEHNMK